jgi:hypothetical protein
MEVNNDNNHIEQVSQAGLYLMEKTSQLSPKRPLRGIFYFK